jgi:hypothetical protein
MYLKETRLEMLVWLRLGSGNGFCEHGNEPSSSIKEGELLE